MKKNLRILLVVLAVLALLALIGFCCYWCQNNWFMVDGEVYSFHSTSLDLREMDISSEYYDELHSQIPDCDILWMVSFQGERYSSDTQSLCVNSLTNEDVEILLNYFPQLTLLDASDCQEWDLLTAFQAQRPDCRVVYRVDLGGILFGQSITQLTLESGDFSYEDLLKNLTYLTHVTGVTLVCTDLTAEQMEELTSTYTSIDFTYTVSLLGEEYGTHTTELDLSSLASEDVAETARKLALLPNLESIELMDENGESALTKADVKALMEAAPGADFHYTFSFYGRTLSTEDEEVVLTDKNIGDENEEDVRLTLDILKNCQRFVLDNCKLSNEVMAQIREDYREQTKVVWRVWYGGGSSLTDVEVVRVVYSLKDYNCHDLVYCEDVVYMDIGHNVSLSDISFVAGMPNLEVIIISGSVVTDLSAFAYCESLRILEACFCEYLVDLSPLASLENLEMLNIGNTRVKDLSPLDDLPLVLLMARVYPDGYCRVPKAERERFIEVHPDCWASFLGEQPYGSGWRYNADNTQMDWYAEAAKQFRYPDAPNKTGWYLQ